MSILHNYSNLSLNNEIPIYKNRKREKKAYLELREEMDGRIALTNGWMMVV